FLLLCLSEPYAAALRADMQKALQILGDRMALISVGFARQQSTVNDSLGPAILPVKARLKSKPGVRGAMQGVNARLGGVVLAHHSKWYPSTTKLADLVRTWVRSSAPLPTRKAERLTDDAVMQFIKSELKAEPRASKSALLRKLRDSGRACEQKRF